MGIEIERKFLVSSDGWRSVAHQSVRMTQGYLNDVQAVAQGREHCSVRIRIAGEQAFLNIKSRAIGPSRQEFEYPLPLDDARALMNLCAAGRIDKIRHLVRRGSHLWEVDEFLGDNFGLILAEIELSAIDEPFVTPDWAGKEVTELPRYYNLALAEHPFKHWTDLERS